MKSRISLVFSVVTAVLLSSCAAMAQMQVRQYTSKPDGVNDNMVYGYIDLGKIGTYGTLVVRLLPMEYELVPKKAGLFGGQSKLVLEPKLSMFEESKLVTQGTAIFWKGVFSVENLTPGEYYAAAMVHTYTSGNVTFTRSYSLGRPQEGSGIQVGADQMIYWGARKMVFGENGEFSLEVSSEVTRKDVAAILAETIADKGWDDRLAAEMQRK